MDLNFFFFLVIIIIKRIQIFKSLARKEGDEVLREIKGVSGHRIRVTPGKRRRQKTKQNKTSEGKLNYPLFFSLLLLPERGEGEREERKNMEGIGKRVISWKLNKKEI
jgi:hypothetical protein